MQVAERPREGANPCSSNPSAASPPLSGSAGLAAVARRGPAAWLRQAMRRGQAVAEERPCAADAAELDGGEPDDASDDCGASAELDAAASFGSLPEHLLEKIFGHMRSVNRKHHFAICGVNRQWRRLGQAMFFSRPWEVAHLICHPTQLFCLSPRNVTGSRSGLLKCFVRREHGPGGRRFSFCIGKDAAQPQRSRFLMAAKPGGRDTMLLYLNSRCAGQPCARLRCNLFATQYKLTLSEDLQLEPTATGSGSADAGAPGGAPPSARRGEYAQYGRLTSWSVEAAAEAAAAAQRLQQQRVEQLARSGGGGPGGATGCHDQPLEVDCFAELQYQARVKGFMQPRRMRVVLPHPSLLFYDQVLPQLSRRPSETAPAALAAQPPQTPPNASPASSAAPGSARRSVASPGGSSGAAAAAAAPQGSPSPAGRPAEDAAGGGAAAADGGAMARWLQRVQRRRLLRPHGSRTVPVGEQLQPTVLQNKAPHWNEGLRCWCLNFRGRVKLASVKNFQLVRGGDPGERVVMQFGKAEQDAFILDFNPTVLTAFQAFAIVLSTFDSKVLL